MAYPDFTPEELATEEWRDIPDFGHHTPAIDRFYQVSSLGRVRVLTTQILKAGPWSDYLRITLFKGRTSAKNFKSFGIHQLVARMFIGPRPSGYLPNHEDGNKLNNRASNLNYKTPSGNTQHAYDTGLSKRGEGMGTAKLSDADAAKIIERLANGEANKVIAGDYPISESIIGLIRQNKIWTHLPRPEGLSNKRIHWSKRMPQYLARGDNNGSRARYDRIPKGKQSHNAKITEENVKNIRELAATGNYLLRELADTFGISKSQTKRIIDRQTWKHVL